MANSADPDQLASEEANDLDLHCLQGKGISRYSMTRVKHITIIQMCNLKIAELIFEPAQGKTNNKTSVTSKDSD